MDQHRTEVHHGCQVAAHPRYLHEAKTWSRTGEITIWRGATLVIIFDCANELDSETEAIWHASNVGRMIIDGTMIPRTFGEALARGKLAPSFDRPNRDKFR